MVALEREAWGNELFIASSSKKQSEMDKLPMNIALC